MPQETDTRWAVWIACPNDGNDGWDEWYCCRFQYTDKARAFADARLVRDGYPGHYVATLPNGKRPLPIQG